MKKTILITGAGTGLGKQVGIELARRGHTAPKWQSIGIQLHRIFGK